MSSPHKTSFDVIVIGSGASGGIAAHILAGAGKSVAIVEQDQLGGDSVHYSVVPRASLLESARRYREARGNMPFGVRTPSITYSYPSFRGRKDEVVMSVTPGKSTYQDDGIQIIKGKAVFTGHHAIRVGDLKYKARDFIIATGSSPVIPDVDDLEEIGFLTYKDAINLNSPPKLLTIIGSDATAIEFADYFATLGSQVTIITADTRLIVQEDKAVSDFVENNFKTKGIEVLVGSTALSVDKFRGRKVITYLRNGSQHEISADEILVSTAYTPNVDLNLEAASVKYNTRGIKVDETMQTSSAHIYAIGDVTNDSPCYDAAIQQAKVAAHNLLHKRKVLMHYHAIPRVIFTHPEIAIVGHTETEAREAGIKLHVATASIATVGKSHITDENYGFVKVIANRSGQILGGTVVAPNASEVIHELALAVSVGLTAADIANTLHVFPSYSEAIKIACQKLA